MYFVQIIVIENPFSTKKSLNFERKPGKFSICCQSKHIETYCIQISTLQNKTCGLQSSLKVTNLLNATYIFGSCSNNCEYYKILQDDSSILVLDIIVQALVSNIVNLQHSSTNKGILKNIQTTTCFFHSHLFFRYFLPKIVNISKFCKQTHQFQYLLLQYMHWRLTYSNSSILAILHIILKIYQTLKCNFCFFTKKCTLGRSAGSGGYFVRKLCNFSICGHSISIVK